MDTFDITHRTNATFVQTFVLTTWCDLYDLSEGHWHAMLRRTVESAVVHYEWSTEAGNLNYEETRAFGEITFTTNPVPGDTLMIGATIIHFPGDVAIGAGLANTLANLLAFLEASTDEDINHCDYAVTSGTVLTMEYKTAGFSATPSHSTPTSPVPRSPGTNAGRRRRDRHDGGARR